MKPTEMSLEQIKAEIDRMEVYPTLNIEPQFMEYSSTGGMCPSGFMATVEFYGVTVFMSDELDTELAAAREALEWIKARKEGKCTFML